MISPLLDCNSLTISEWFSNSYSAVMNFGADPQYIIQYSGIIAGFISITVPIALDIVSKHTEDFKDKEISNLFLKTWLYRFQVYINLTIVFLCILLIAMGIKSGIWMLLIIVLDLLAIVVFVFFLRMVQQFATNFADYYSTKLKKRSDEIVQGK